MNHVLQYITLPNITAVVGITIGLVIAYLNCKNDQQPEIYFLSFICVSLGLLLMALLALDTSNKQEQSWKTIYQTGDNITLNIKNDNLDISTDQTIGSNAEKLKPNTPVNVTATKDKDTTTKTVNIEKIDGKLTPNSKIVKVKYQKETSSIRITVTNTTSDDLDSLFDN